MKHQQVVVDYWTMAKTSLTYLILVAGAWVMFRLFHAVFWFPQMMQQKHEELAQTIEYHSKRLQESMEKNKEQIEGTVTESSEPPAEEDKKDK
ncbi:uncharacterized protein LOC132260836 [Phlebotomus argentipes]|uniref:uncharacterized protein LOC132260836 n=1 Tax=Phlebotomus argentipes TaxID=94469 RepID=UPI002892CEEF|nr:uncharacterized protein LOC132260836 [Phlebotomus argentipes]